ncbi:predicted protein [Lichtheimia corymbifera JMRC:FSU:9682]|uniref:Uncharacterized protein n=1 Tax=Lichtheimia corymbifera JMRC:FSU:9682 TaxID=1263082 RepID=A0A068RW28_9FUNG|nr:predicted protein [Lichtheimia corymbifera JMRC:FSU:9682]
MENTMPSADGTTSAINYNRNTSDLQLVERDTMKMTQNEETKNWMEKKAYQHLSQRHIRIGLGNGYDDGMELTKGVYSHG